MTFVWHIQHFANLSFAATSPVRTDSFSELLSLAHRRSPATISAEALEKLSTTADSPRPGTYCTEMNVVFGLGCFLVKV